MFIVAALSGCGYKTNPRPATAAVPSEVGLVNAQGHQDRIVLKWEVPVRNIDGSALTDVSGFKVYRTMHKIDEECENCESKSVLHANIDYQNPSNATVEKGMVTFADSQVAPGNVYNYYISVYNLKGRESRTSQEVAVVFDKAPPPPAALKGEADAKGVRLEWSVPEDGRGIKNYRIYRADAEAPRDLKQLGSTKWGENSFTDRTAETGKTYNYAVTSLKMNKGVSIESDFSQTVPIYFSVVHRNPPENVNTASTSEGIRVYWDPVKIGEDETRYNVYRSEGRKMFVKINTEPIRNASFLDKKVARNREYRYAVTAFSKNRPDQESSRSGSGAIIYKP
jgi:hypothetical protein